VGKTIVQVVAPGYLKTPKVTVALIAMALGLVPDGGNATASRAGVNELHVSGDKPDDEMNNTCIMEPSSTINTRFVASKEGFSGIIPDCRR
jgi:hypothetical protein